MQYIKCENINKYNLYKDFKISKINNCFKKYIY